MKNSLRILTLAALALPIALVACGGGGGSSGGGGGGGVIPTPTPPPTTTTATGQLVTDPGGVAIPGVAVHIQPWAVYPTPGPSPTPLAISATTDASGNFTLANVPNGQYLLVIGTDLASDQTNPTIHDHITLTGGVQALVAPTLPAIPIVTFTAVETSGKYRFRSLAGTCFAETSAARTASPALVADEWLTESSYWYSQWHNAAGFPGAATPNNNGTFSTSSAAEFPSTGCAHLVASSLSAVNAASVWFGGYYEPTGQKFADIQTAGDMRVTPANSGNAVWP